MNHYKLAHDAKDHFVIHDTRDGKQFKMAKAAMSEANYQKVKGLQRFADGGEVETANGDSSPTTYSEQDIQNSMAGSSPADGSVNQSATGTNPTVATDNPDTPSPTLPDASAQQAPPSDGTMPPSDPSVAQPPPMASPAGSGQIARGINEDAKAQSDLGNKVAGIQGDNVSALQANQAQYKTQVDSLNKKSMDLFNAAQTDKVDPNHYWTGDADGKGSHSKITAAIALFLGGIGGGMSGKGGNVALDQINRGIDQDIAAQKTNIENKRSLINQNLAITGSVQAAEAMTQSQLLTITAAKVAQAQAQAVAPEAKARADQLLGALKGQIAAANQKTALLQSQARITAGQGSSQDLMMADPKTQARAVRLPNGQVALANSDDEAKSVRENLASTQDIVSGLDRLDKLGPEAGVPGTAENKEAQSLVTALKFKVANNEGIKRHSPELLDLIGKQFGDPSALKSSLGMNGAARTDALRQTLTDAQVSNFKNKLVNYQAPYRPSTAKKGFK